MVPDAREKYKKSTGKKSDILVDSDYRQLKITCLLGIFLSPLATGIWASIYPEMRSEIPTSLVYSVIFLSFYIITRISGFIRRNAYLYMFILCYMLSLTLIFFAYLNSFPEAYAWILIFVILAVIMLLKRISHIIFYLAGMLGTTFIALYSLNIPDTSRYDTAAALAMFSIVAVIFMKTKLDAQQELKKSEQHYRSLVEISPFAIMVHQDGRIVFTNSSAASMAGAADCRSLSADIFQTLLQITTP